MFRTRETKLPKDAMRLMEDVSSIEALSAHGARVINTTEPELVLGGMAYVSGVSAFAVGFLGAGAGALVSLPFVAQVKYY